MAQLRCFRRVPRTGSTAMAVGASEVDRSDERAVKRQRTAALHDAGATSGNLVEDAAGLRTALRWFAMIWADRQVSPTKIGRAELPLHRDLRQTSAAMSSTSATRRKITDRAPAAPWSIPERRASTRPGWADARSCRAMLGAPARSLDVNRPESPSGCQPLLASCPLVFNRGSFSPAADPARLINH